VHLSLFLRRTALLALIAGAGGALYYFWLRPSPLLEQSPQPAPSSMARPSAPPLIHYPVPSDAPSPGSRGGSSALGPLPTLDKSDPPLTEALSALLGKEFEVLLVQKGLIQRIVVTVDGVAGRKQPPANLLPLIPPDSDFISAGNGDNQTISVENFKRYSPYVELLRSMKLKPLVSLYTHFYPLFQSAYLDLGTPGYFNDRLVAVLDLLLATPETSAPIAVGRPSLDGRLKFYDDRLEQLSSGQKLLLRMGAENAHIIKSKLRELRALLVHLGS
jgi:hypothetical protein